MVKPILVSKLSAYNEGSRPLSELIDLGRVILGIWVRYQKNTGQVFADINTYTNTSSLNVVIIEQFWKYTILSCLDRQRCQIGQFSAQIRRVFAKIGRFYPKIATKVSIITLLSILHLGINTIDTLIHMPTPTVERKYSRMFVLNSCSG